MTMAHIIQNCTVYNPFKITLCTCIHVGEIERKVLEGAILFPLQLLREDKVSTANGEAHTLLHEGFRCYI